MEETTITIDQLIRLKYSGAMSDLSMYMTLAIQTGAVLIGGIVIWRMSSRIHAKKRAERKRNAYFDTPYSKGWKRK